MADPSVFADWIASRVKTVASTHTWATSLDSTLYKWAYAVENHASHTEHFGEPPIPVVVGYLARIALETGAVPDPVDDHTNPLKPIHFAETSAIGGAAALLHGKWQGTHDLIPHGSKTPQPIDVLASWIKERIVYAADPQKGDQWLKELETWIDCIDPANGGLGAGADPIPLAVGYVVQAACNYTHVASKNDPLAAANCRLMGATMAVLAKWTGSWNSCDEPGANDEAVALESTLERICTT